MTTPKMECILSPTPFDSHRLLVINVYELDNSLMNLIFKACVACINPIKKDKKPSSSNSIFQTRDVENQVQFNKGSAPCVIMLN